MFKVERHWIIIYLMLYVNLFTTNHIHGQFNEIKNYIHNNLPLDNQNWNISQNPRNGIIYFANSQGLIEYNGISQKIYQMPLKKTVRSVLVDDQGLIFTGAFEEFGYWEKKQDGELTYNSLSKNIPVLPNDEIWKIYNYFGKIYFQSFTTIYVYDYKKVTAIKAQWTMLFLFKTGGQFIAQLFSDGLYWFNGEEFRHIKGSEIFKDIKVHAIIKRSRDQLFICTENQGIFLFDGKKFQPFKSEVSSFLINYTCNASLSIRDSIFVFGTILNGIVISDGKGKILKHYNYLNGLNNNTVLSLYKDNNDDLWVGLDNGANYINIFSPCTYYLNSTGNLGTIYAILPDKDKLYLGTNHGLFVSDISRVGDLYDFTNTHLVPLSNGQVWTLGKFDNQILCGHNEGTFRVDGNEFIKISGITGGWSIREYHGYLIESNYTGLVIFHKDSKGNWVFRNQVRGYGEPSRHFEIDYLGYLWATDLHKGIYKLELNDLMDSVIKKNYYDISGDKSYNCGVFLLNNKVVFTLSDKIYAYNYENNKIEPFTKLNQQLGDYKNSQKIFLYKKNKYWFTKGNKIGLFEINKDFSAKKELEIIQKEEGSKDMEKQIDTLNANNLVISDPQLFSVYKLNYNIPASVRQKVRISKIEFQGKNKRIDINPEYTRNINAAFATNNVSIYFSYPNEFDWPDKVFYYMMPEIDNEWHETRLDNITYLNLKNGTYHLKIRAEGNNESTETTFRINTPWMLTWYAFLIYVVVFCGIIILSIRIFRSELQLHKQMISYELKESKLANELDLKSNELLLTIRYMIQKDEILAKIKEQINLIKENTSKYPVKSLKYMIKIIDDGLELQTEEWKHAINNLQLAEQGFFKSLKLKYPNLTPNDLKLCSYLKMNFSTKEIAKLFKISTRAIEISRYRLRKKMNLGHEVNLTEYLNME